MTGTQQRRKHPTRRLQQNCCSGRGTAKQQGTSKAPAARPSALGWEAVNDDEDTPEDGTPHATAVEG
eukprot:CAMPEP_0177484254 /NCGR_PEP_ID=MMETSP0369-20130122/27919_1 /TAXON_ID=447022 ORGANISM="Scrippsiella hangoei-like, Strain SHHI-4" /NCGR_SAMPLE_ID=MMETSP0369 /ASSEMBLY_ACC=CAM_ASM_000364 /LENGTH=66 /DNA_ID=CAMNT_0018960333 /DNA_START=262 /DNA_END=463 /DNA_ORIENTATION=-